MSGGGPPHHPHNRHVPPANSAWNHLAVPYFSRQPQVAHMQTEHPLLHQSTWHTPTTTDAMKMMPRSQMLNDMFKSESMFPRDCVDLSRTRNGNQNGELPPAPTAISLSVRDANKINSLPSSMLNIHAVELTKCTSPSLKSAVSPGSIRAASISPGLKSSSPGSLGSSSAPSKALSPGRKSVSPAPKASSPGVNLGSAVVLTTPAAMASASELSKNLKRSNVRVDSILERLNPIPEKQTFPYQDVKSERALITVPVPEKVQLQDKIPFQNQSVIVSAANTYDENSNSSGTTNVPTPKEEDTASLHSNEDSLDSMKSRRKRKPSKTVRVNKEEDIKSEKDQVDGLLDPHTSDIKEEPTDLTSYSADTCGTSSVVADTPKPAERLEPNDSVDANEVSTKTRRKTSSESETIDNIAAMVQEGLKDKTKKNGEEDAKTEDSRLKIGNSDEPEEAKETPSDAEKANVKTTDEAVHCTDEEAEPIDSKKESLPELVKSQDSDLVLQNATPKTEPVENDVKKVIVEQTVPTESGSAKPVTVSVIKMKDDLENTLMDLEVRKAESTNSTEKNSAPAAILTAPAQKKASITHFVEVENKLEEMFAGIEDHVNINANNSQVETSKHDSNLGLIDDNKLDDSLTSLKRETMVTEAEPSHDLPDGPVIKSEPLKEINDKKQLKKSKLSTKRESDTDDEVPTKKKKLMKSKLTGSTMKKSRRPSTSTSVLSTTKKTSTVITSSKPSVKVPTLDIAKEYSYDSGSNASSSKSRGPYVQIRGPRDSPLSVNVINAPLTVDEDGERKSLKNKKFHDDSEYRHKVRSKGLHCSTLSNKYDAERKDATWICAFCKRGPHANELTGPSVLNEIPTPGDLFGPYIITTQCPEFEKRLDDPYDRQFKSRKIGKALDAAAASKNNKKAKRKSESSVPGDGFLGITDTGNNSFEVWTHEDCMVWSPGVYLVGPKIVGLEEAVWMCSNVSCTSCGLRGANVTCVKRGCLSAAHVCCARKALWPLDEVNFKAYCPEHAPR